MSQLVNADDTSVIEIKTATDTSLKEVISLYKEIDISLPDYVTRNNHSCTIKIVLALMPGFPVSPPIKTASYASYFARADLTKGNLLNKVSHYISCPA